MFYDFFPILNTPVETGNTLLCGCIFDPVTSIIMRVVLRKHFFKILERYFKVDASEFIDYIVDMFLSCRLWGLLKLQSPNGSNKLIYISTYIYNTLHSGGCHDNNIIIK